MPQIDRIHGSVRRALIHDGWSISHEHKRIAVARPALIYGVVDLYAEQPIAAERHGRLIAVEVKGLLGDSPSSDFMEAVGQYVAYRAWLAVIEPEREIWLAVPGQRYRDLLRDPGAQVVIQDQRMRIIVVDVHTERIVAWMS